MADVTAKLAEALRLIDGTLQGALANAENMREMAEDADAAQVIAREALRLYEAKAQPKQAAEPVAWIPADALAQLEDPLLLLRNVPLYAYAGEDLVPLYAAPVAQAEQWQPIETAPKDGWFLAHKPKTEHIVATILDSEHPDCQFDGGVHEAWTHQYVDGVTHWMPLPQPPKEQP